MKFKNISLINQQTAKEMLLSWATVGKALDLAEQCGWEEPYITSGIDDEEEEGAVEINKITLSATEARQLAKFIEQGLARIESDEHGQKKPLVFHHKSRGYNDISPRQYFMGVHKVLLTKIVEFLRKGACVFLMHDNLSPADSELISEPVICKWSDGNVYNGDFDDGE